ncbi:MAG TPA: bifunctional phosphoribosyl-AMP cyclohydrolase/phosphoribosyl-ATP diphosphatase HisIE [Actinobacteria bacterium]|nr:bifunctional phosphoribosyl-AMP cyclohydrolase/phosphoribosyl-ATP diphosphatase HisIE [Actinomycetota bacterium]
MNPEAVRFDERGLVPAVVQDADDATVLMVGWMDRAALDRTLATGEVHFWSRSRRRLWKKGETSGHVLHVVDVGVDCDADTLLVRARPEGPTCHTGSRSCFTTASPGVLAELWSTILDRKATSPDGSYTARLLDGGVDRVGRKVVEEATEVLLAAKDHVHGGPDRRIVEEAADLLYHLLVLLASRDVDLEEVLAELSRRRR